MKKSLTLLKAASNNAGEHGPWRRSPGAEVSGVRGESANPSGDHLVEIQIGENDRLDWALKQFRRRMIRSGLFKDMRRKRFYEKPSEARKAKAKAAERRKHKDRKRERRATQI